MLPADKISLLATLVIGALAMVSGSKRLGWAILGASVVLAVDIWLLPMPGWLIGSLMLVMGGLTFLLFPSAQRFREEQELRRVLRQDKAEADEQRETERGRRGLFRPYTRAWDRFQPAASRLRAYIADLLSASERPADWQVTLGTKLSGALALAANLSPGDRDKAIGKLRRMEEEAKGGEQALNRLASLADDLDSWVRETNERYRRMKQAAGIPT